MKKKIISVFSGIGILFLSGCFFQLPEKISIKTNANYNFSMGNTKKSFSDVFSVNDILSSASTENTRIKIYDYNPSKNSAKVQQFLAKVPIQEIPVDFSEYFKGSKIFDQIEAMSFEKTISIPEVKTDITTKFDLSGLRKAVSALASFSGSTNDTSVKFVSENAFSAITYTSGSLVVSSNTNGSVKLSYLGNTIGTGVFKEGKAAISLKDVTLYSSGMTIEFSNSNSGTVYTATVSEDSLVKTATGINMSDLSIPITANFQTGLTALGVIECDVNNGSINMAVSFPETWKNTSATYQLSLEGGINASSSQPASPVEIDLKGKKITASDVVLTMNMKMSAVNGTFVFADSPKLATGLKLSSYNLIKMNLEGVKTDLQSTEKLAPEVREFVKSLVIKESGIVGTYTNELPEGNDLSINVSSSFFGLNSSGSLRAKTSNGSVRLLSSSSPKTVTLKHPVTNVGEYEAFDYNLNILFPGATKENPNVVSVKNVESGQEYKISAKFSSEMKWDQIVMYSVGASQKGSVPTGVSLNTLFGSFENSAGADFAKKITFEKLPFYLYFERPDMSAFNNATFKGGYLDCYMGKSVSGKAVKSTNSKVVNFLSSGQSLEFKKFPTLQKEGSVVISDISTAESSVHKDLAELLNLSVTESDSGLCIDYDIQFSTGQSSEFTIYYDDFKKSTNGVSSIAIYAAMVLPLKFNVSDDIKVNFMGLAGFSIDSDLLGRTEKPTESEMVNYLNAIQYASLVYKNKQLPFYSESPIQFHVNFSGSDNEKDYEILDITEGAIQVNPVDFIYTYPLIPKLYLVIPKSPFSMTRDMGFETALSLSIVTNGEIEVFGGSK